MPCAETFHFVLLLASSVSFNGIGLHRQSVSLCHCPVTPLISSTVDKTNHSLKAVNASYTDLQHFLFQLRLWTIHDHNCHSRRHNVWLPLLVTQRDANVHTRTVNQSKGNRHWHDCSTRGFNESELPQYCLENSGCKDSQSLQRCLAV